MWTLVVVFSLCASVAGGDDGACDDAHVHAAPPHDSVLSLPLFAGRRAALAGDALADGDWVARGQAAYARGDARAAAQLMSAAAKALCVHDSAGAHAAGLDLVRLLELDADVPSMEGLLGPPGLSHSRSGIL